MPDPKEEMEAVSTKIPKIFISLFNEHIEGKEYNSISEYMRDLIRKDLKKRKLLS